MKPSDNIDAQLSVALVLNELKCFDDVIMCYKSILEQDSSCIIALFNLGNAYLDQQNYEDALDTFKVLIRIYSYYNIISIVVIV